MVYFLKYCNGKFSIGYHSITGNYDDGYTVWRTESGEDSDTVYAHKSFEKCIVWCMNRTELINKLVDYIILTGTANTTSGNWIFYYDELIKLFDIAPQDMQSIAEEVAAALIDRDECNWDTQIVEKDCLSVMFYTNYCPNVEN